MRINEEHLLALAGDDRELVAEVVTDFRDVSLGLVGQMKAALCEKNEDGLKVFLHQLKGSSGTLGMVTLFETCRDLELENFDSWEKQGDERCENLEVEIRESAQLALNCLVR